MVLVGLALLVVPGLLVVFVLSLVLALGFVFIFELVLVLESASRASTSKA